jgi:sigma-B regulation protein RsbU (phosphoserine phosphatase)
MARGMFVTLAFGVLDVATGAFDYASGGHEEGFHLGADPGAHPLPVTGPAVGLFETARYRGHQVRLSPGDQVLIATDGVTEAFNPQRQAFGLDRLTTRLAERPLPEPQALIDGLEADVARFVEGAPASDDLTLLALHWRG